MAYYGNLALRPERKPQDVQQPARNREKVIRRRQLPLGEKLLYLFTVFVFVVVAGLVIYRYAEIYQMSREIQNLNREYEKTTVQMKEMQREVELLSDQKRIIDMAKKELGMVQIDPNKGITIGDSGQAVAMNTKK